MNHVTDSTQRWRESWPTRLLTAALLVLLPLAVHAQDHGFEIIHFFKGQKGAFPDGELIQGPDGTLHGTSSGGGKYSDGTLFSSTLDGRVSVDHTFRCKRGEKNLGCRPDGGLALGNDGRLYGTTGGAVFAMDADGKVEGVHLFDQQLEGSDPGAVLSASDGNIYGTTFFGPDYSDFGTIFRVTSAGSFQTLHVFTSAEGVGPNALIEGPDGALYATLRTSGPDGGGTFYRMSLDGSVEVLHSFSSNGNGGTRPSNRLLLARDGSFYGMTEVGGQFGKGTVYRMTLSGEMTVLHSFEDGAIGAYPSGALVQASSGDLYGTTSRGGANDKGTIFRMRLNGALTTLHHFAGSDGFDPDGGLIQASNGWLYGTTSGATNFYGTIFRIKAD